MSCRRAPAEAPIRAKMERNMLAQFQRLPGLESSMPGAQSARGAHGVRGPSRGLGAGASGRGGGAGGGRQRWPTAAAPSRIRRWRTARRARERRGHRAVGRGARGRAACIMRAPARGAEAARTDRPLFCRADLVVAAVGGWSLCVFTPFSPRLHRFCLRSSFAKYFARRGLSRLESSFLAHVIFITSRRKAHTDFALVQIPSRPKCVAVSELALRYG